MNDRQGSQDLRTAPECEYEESATAVQRNAALRTRLGRRKRRQNQRRPRSGEGVRRRQRICSFVSSPPERSIESGIISDDSLLALPLV